MAKTSKYAVNEICFNGKTYVHNPLFRVVGSGSTPSDPEGGTLNVDWFENVRGEDTGNVYTPGEGSPDVHSLHASVTFDIPYRGRVNECYVAGESDSFYYRGSMVAYLDIPRGAVLDIVYSGRWNIMSLPDIMCIKYDDLKWLTEMGDLIPGMKYRIIDYIPNMRTEQIHGGHYHVDASVTQFDIIVTALSNTELSEDAEACLPEQNAAARNYYKSFNINLGSWKLKYTIDDNPIKYDWATGYVVNNPGTTLYTDGKKYAFGLAGDGEYIGYTNDYNFIRYEGGRPTYVFELNFDSCYTVNVGPADDESSDWKTFTVYGSEVTVYKQFQYVIDGELYYASGDIYFEGMFAQSNIFLISESHFNSSASVIYGIYIEYPYVWEKDEITSITWHPDNRGVVYKMIDDKGNEAPWDFKNICIGQITNTANIGHFFEKQCVNGIFRDASIECNTMFNNVIKPTTFSNIGMWPWGCLPYRMSSNRFRMITYDTSIDNMYISGIHDNILEDCWNVTIISNGAFSDVADNHIMHSSSTTVSGWKNRISHLTSGYASYIYGNENTVLGGYGIKIGSSGVASNYNTVGSNCRTITIGYSCNHNSIGAGCSNITLGPSNNYNSMGIGCNNIVLGTSCNRNSYGNGCSYCYVKQGASSSSSYKNYVVNCHWDDGVYHVTLYNASTSSSPVQNIHVHRGMYFTSEKFVGVPINTAYEHNVTRALPSSSNSTIVS